jgi:predicted ATPase
VFHKVRSDLRRADEMSHRLLEMANESGDSALVLQAHQSMCVTNLCLGNPRITIDHMNQAAAVYDAGVHSANSLRFGQDPGVATLAMGAVALLLTGQEAQALETSERALKLAKKLSQPTTTSLAMFFGAMLHQLHGDPTSTERLAQQTIDLASDAGFSFWLAGGRVLRGWAWAVRGGGEVGIAEIRRGLANWSATGSRTYQPYYLGLLADALLRMDQPNEALPVLEEALQASASLPEGLCEAQLWRLKGRVLQVSGDMTGASECIERATRTARSQRAQWLEKPLDF